MGEADLAAVRSEIRFSCMFHVESPVGHPHGVFKWVVRYLGQEPMGEKARLEASIFPWNLKPIDWRPLPQTDNTKSHIQLFNTVKGYASLSLGSGES